MTAVYRILAVIAIFATVVGAVGAAAAQQRKIPVPLSERQGVDINSIDLAQAAGGNVNVEVISACIDGVASFKVVNQGEKWPELGKLRVYQISNGQARELTARTMRFAEGQQASFRMKSQDNSSIGLFVEPSWYDRPFQYDAEVSCGQ
ncbi:MAG: hypothetical protein JJ900_10125 [Rhodospirillales bacterium]|nr:hypothetical protein [Rhodospirillales bacterium]MBO6787196.1 hypothetical protein [Rhodospirillales bacterium]